MAKIAATVILYNPADNTVKNIMSYLPFIHRLYVYDNSKYANSELLSNLNSPTIIYHHDGNNRGIAERLNQAVSAAQEDGFELLLTMDQDSRFSPGDVQIYVNCIVSFPEKYRVAMFGIETGLLDRDNNAGCEFELVKELITSGSVINLQNSSQVGRFDENLFIDEVDLDYCYSASIVGLTLVKFKNITLNHHLGTVSYHRSLATLKKTPRTLHSPIRLYYIVRNHFYLSRKFSGKFDQEMMHKRKLLWNRLKNNILYNKKRLAVLKYSILGFTHYLAGKKGKLHG